jgi:hypothetical protein
MRALLTLTALLFPGGLLAGEVSTFRAYVDSDLRSRAKPSRRMAR